MATIVIMIILSAVLLRRPHACDDDCMDNELHAF
jgi:hypothetical protein